MGANSPRRLTRTWCRYAQALQKNTALPAIDLQTPDTVAARFMSIAAGKSPQFADLSGREKTSEPATHWSSQTNEKTLQNAGFP
jgi:hypothetical protein